MWFRVSSIFGGGCAGVSFRRRRSRAEIDMISRLSWCSAGLSVEGFGAVGGAEEVTHSAISEGGGSRCAFARRELRKVLCCMTRVPRMKGLRSVWSSWGESLPCAGQYAGWNRGGARVPERYLLMVVV